MASIKRRRGAKIWTAYYRDAHGIQHCRSTYLDDKKAAQRVADEYESASREKQSLRQINRVLSEMRALAGSQQASVTLRAYTLSWLAEKKPEVAAATYAFYSQVVRDFLGHLGEAADHDITLISKTQLAAYRSHLAANVSANTTNHHLAAVKMLFRAARRDSVIADDPSEFVGVVRAEQSTGGRRAFTLPELEAVLSIADPEWQSMILFGLYTGQRLGDIARLSWANVDLERNELRLATAKTGRQVVLPLAAPLRTHIESLPSADDLSAPIHPRAAAMGKVSDLSTQFATLLIHAGLREAAAGAKEAGSSRRTQFSLSYHSLRHTTVSLLHSAGVTQSVSETFAGHSSSSIHRLYVHSDRESLQRAADLLPVLRCG